MSLVARSMIALAILASSAVRASTDKTLPQMPLAAGRIVVEIVATPGATLLDVAGPAEVFGVLTGHAVEYVVSDDTGPFKLQNVIVVSPDCTFDTRPALTVARRLEYPGTGWMTNSW